MPSTVVVDSGPLIALFDKRDGHHHESTACFRESSAQCVTTLAVVTEVAYVLQFDQAAQIAFLEWVSASELVVIPLSPADLATVIKVMRKYSDLPADFADATLVVTAEKLGVRDIVTFDRDFDVYRYRNRARFRRLPK